MLIDKLILGLTLSLTLGFADYHAKVVHVSDGDTIKVRNEAGQEQTIRIRYIDTPEKFESSKLDKNAINNGYSKDREQKLGILASEYAHKMLDNKMVVIASEKGLDKYKRNLATIIFDKGNYSAKIISDGYACIYKKDRYPRELDTMLSNARTQKKGLWAVDFETMDKLCKF